MERKTSSSSNYYFTQETEDAIILYNQSSDPVLRSKIFSQQLYYPFYKMAENIIHTFKFYYMDVNDIEDLKLDIVTMIVEEKLQGFNPQNGAKAFSYFQTIIKRWLINYNNNNYKKLKQIGSFEEVHDSYNSDLEKVNTQTIQLTKIVDEFIDKSYGRFEDLFPKESDKEVADAVLTLFRTRHDLDIFKKKALYIYIREITDCETPVLTKVIGKLKEEFYSIYRKYVELDYEIE